MRRSVQHPLTATLETQGRSARWLAKRVGVSPAYITRVIQGERTASSEFKGKVAEALGVPESLLFPETRAA